jgi:hypothetical protein
MVNAVIGMDRVVSWILIAAGSISVHQADVQRRQIFCLMKQLTLTAEIIVLPAVFRVV